MFSYGYGNFWNFGFQGSAAVQRLLTQPDLTLTQLLEEEGLISELKTQNPKLLDFLLKRENFKQLINYVIYESTEDPQTNRLRSYKYPFVCADVLSSESPAVFNEFFKAQEQQTEETPNRESYEKIPDDQVNLGEDDSNDGFYSPITEKAPTSKSPTNKSESLEHLDYLFSFLDAQEISLTVAGYFSKIVNNLLTKKSAEFLAYIYETHPALLKKLVDHVYSKSVAEFLSKLLTFESSAFTSANNLEDEVYNGLRIQTIKLLVEKLDPKNDSETINNSAFLICEVFGKYNSMYCASKILGSLLDRPAIDNFFKILKLESSISSCAVALILGNIFAYYILISSSSRVQQETSNDDNFDDFESTSPSARNDSAEVKDDIPLVAAAIENIPSLIKYLASVQGTNITSQYGANIVPFGSARLKLLELLFIAMKANNKTILKTLAEAGFIETLLQLILKFEWNNMLHNQIEKILFFVIDGNSEELKTALFEKANFIDFIEFACRDSEYVLTGKHARKVRKGYLGQLVRIANKINDSNDAIISNYVENSDKWKEFVQTQLTPVNQRNKINLGGKDPRASFFDEEEALAEGFSLPQGNSRLSNADNTNDETDQQNDQDNEDDNNGGDDDSDEELEDNAERDDNQEDNQDEQEETQPVYSGRPSGILTLYQNNSDDDKEENSAEEILESSPVIDDSPVESPIETGDAVSNSMSQAEQSNISPPPKELETESKSTEEETVNEEFYSNVYWKNNSLHSIEDVLRDIEIV